MDLFESARVSELASLIKKYQASYYNGEGEISDAEFDKLWDDLKTLDPDNEVLKKLVLIQEILKKELTLCLWAVRKRLQIQNSF